LSRALVLALLLAWHAAAAAQAQGFAVTPARTEAAGDALTHAIVVANLAGNCERFRARLARDPAAALAGWRERNLARTSAADSYLVYAHAAIARQEGDAAAQAFNARTRGLFRRKANTALNDIFERAAPQFEVCARWIDAIAEGKADLNWESKYLNTLDELVKFEQAVRQGGGPRPR
jgi:hypothetical protein